MRQAMVNLYAFDELNDEAQETGIADRRAYLRALLEDELDEYIRGEMELARITPMFYCFNENHFIEITWEADLAAVQELAALLAFKRKIDPHSLEVIQGMKHFNLGIEFNDENQTHDITIDSAGANARQLQAAEEFRTAVAMHLARFVYDVSLHVHLKHEQLDADDFIIADIREQQLWFSEVGYLWTWDDFTFINGANSNSPQQKGTNMTTISSNGPMPINEHAELALTSSGNLLNFIQRIVMDDDRLCELTGFPREACETIHAAARVAEDAHHGQYRKGTNIPYIMHPFGVAALLLREACTPEMVIAGLLHDTVEDADITIQEIAEGYGQDVAHIVAGCSEPDKSLSWQERKEHTIEHLKTASHGVRMVTCADKLHNITAIARDFADQGDDLWSRFNAGKEQQAWYYRGLVVSLAHDDLAETTMYQEFKGLVEATFSS